MTEIFLRAVVYLALFSMGQTLFAASQTLRLEDDSNSRIVVENAIVNGDETTILFWTRPDIGDPNLGKSCALNFYKVTLTSGLPAVSVKTVAKGVCSGFFAKAGLLNSGDALIFVRDRLELWRTGERISSEPFSSIDATSRMRITTDDTGAQFYDISPAGDIVLAIPVGGYIAQDFPGSTLIMAGLKPGGEERWELKLGDVGQHFTIERIWAALDGGALLSINVHSTQGMMAVSEPQLRFVSSGGKQQQISLIEMEEQFDLESIRPGSQEDMQRFFDHQKKSRPESIKKLAAMAREGGGFDVLFHRKGGADGREGHLLYRIGPDGSLLSEIHLGNHIVEHGFEKWFDFYVSGNELILLSRVIATQHGVQAKRKVWSQNAVSWIDLDTGLPTARLIPLDRRYLEAAMNAGDEEMQYLEGLPGGDPVLLTTVGGKPLDVSIGWISKRQVLRLNEADEHLVAYTEAFDKKQAKLAKEAARQQRKADREARKQQMNTDMAAAVGMTPEEYAALSNKERKEAMVRQGDLDAMQAAAEKQAQMAQRGTATQQGAMPQDANAQIAAALAQAQEQMANDPNMTPEMRAQMEAIMAQMGQGAGGQIAAPPAVAATQEDSANENRGPDKVLTVDALQRGHVQFNNPEGESTTMIVLNRKTGDELLNKIFEDGVIDEYISLGRYKLPMEHMGIIIKNSSGEVLEDLTPNAQ